MVLLDSHNCADKLKDKVAVVTGAGRGIGRAIAIAFAQAGAAVCCSARTETEILNTVSEIEGFGGRAIAKVADVTNPEAVHSMHEFAVNAFQGIDILVVNAGVSLNTSVANSDTEQWQNVLQTNLFGAYLTARAALPHLRRQGGGKIIFIGSGLGHRGAADTSAYACSKAGIWMLTRVLAQEVIADNICVNELIPGPVKTAINMQDEEALRTQLGKNEWIKVPADVVPIALFLATQTNDGPTAQSFSLMRRES